MSTDHLEESVTNQCGTCRHWNRKSDAEQVPGMPAQGECRCLPPDIRLQPAPVPTKLFAVNAPQQQSYQVVAFYKPLPEHFAACSQYEMSLTADDGTKPVIESKDA